MSPSSRRAVIENLFGKKDAEKNRKTLCVRPPYHHKDYDFSLVCSQCKDTPCVGACEENIITLDAAHTPCLDFTKRGCTFCDACANACPNGILDITCKSDLDIGVEIDIMACMAWHQSLCNSCLDACQSRAIHFLGLFRPSIEPTLCTGCGCCIGICPSDALRINVKERLCDG